MKEATRASNEEFEIFYTRPSFPLTGTFFPKKNRISQIDILDLGESYSITLTFEKDPRKGVSVKSGLLRITTKWRDDNMTFQVDPIIRTAVRLK